MTNKTISISEDVHNDLKNLKILERETFNDVIRRIIDDNQNYEIKQTVDDCFALQEKYGVVPDDPSQGVCHELACHKECLRLQGLQEREGKITDGNKQEALLCKTNSLS